MSRGSPFNYDENDDDYYSDYYNIDEDDDNNNNCKISIAHKSYTIIQAPTRNKQNQSLEHGTADILGGK